MQIHFVRSGGLMGRQVRAHLNTDLMPEEQANALKGMVEQADFFSLEQTPASPNVADQFQYQVTVESGDRQHTVETGDVSCPDTLRPLLQRLTILARNQAYQTPDTGASEPNEPVSGLGGIEGLAADNGDSSEPDWA